MTDLFDFFREMDTYFWSYSVTTLAGVGVRRVARRLDEQFEKRLSSDAPATTGAPEPLAVAVGRLLGAAGLALVLVGAVGLLLMLLTRLLGLVL